MMKPLSTSFVLSEMLARLPLSGMAILSTFVGYGISVYLTAIASGAPEMKQSLSFQDWSLRTQEIPMYLPEPSNICSILQTSWPANSVIFIERQTLIDLSTVPGLSPISRRAIRNTLFWNGPENSKQNSHTTGTLVPLRDWMPIVMETCPGGLITNHQAG
ncbi:MAG: putative lysis protein [Whadcovirus faecenecus]|uniref:Lysis protein n=1 Tax=Leviviridae sp. TaxID=2027243 RepID=A0ABY4D6N8_9VIRU|nr:MAG: putative lysis protein [Leviviridae sp.]